MDKKPEVPEVPPAGDDEKDRRKRKDGAGKLPPLGGSLGALMTVFRQDYQSSRGGGGGGDGAAGALSREGTYDQLRRCRYLREREYMDDEEKEEARRAKTSSWGADALKT